MKRNIISFTFFFLVLSFIFASLFYVSTFVKKQKGTISEKKIIVCTTMLISDIVRNLIDETYEVITLMGPGIDPHTYKVKPSDVTTLLFAEAIFYNGLHLEGKMGDLFETLSKEKKVICVTNGISRQELIESEYGGIFDPHVWHDHLLWKKVFYYIRNTLLDLYENKKELITENAKRYEKKFDDIEHEINTILKPLDINNRILISAHDAFHYFGRRYHFQVLALQGMSTETDIGIKDVQILADIIIKDKVRAIFVESCISPRNIIALKEAVKKKGWNVTIGGELFSDSLSEHEGLAADYFAMMRHNVHTIVTALLP